ncbi:MAG: hypothetical protein VB084_13580 [Syntrophomonadaceae bacterium]|nr:hypothetical protein [Syntrophomonadaceae bacterium]
MNISKTRGILYLIAKILGDISAVKNQTVGKRVVRRVAGRVSGKMMGKFFK